MDNACIHHRDQILELADSKGLLFCSCNLAPDNFPGVQIEYLPPYLLDLNPIKETFSKIKAFIHCNNNIFQSSNEDDGILYDMHEAMDIISKDDAVGYFIHVGYF